MSRIAPRIDGVHPLRVLTVRLRFLNWLHTTANQLVKFACYEQSRVVHNGTVVVQDFSKVEGGENVLIRHPLRAAPDRPRL